jgi:hypothetical protein
MAQGVEHLPNNKTELGEPVEHKNTNRCIKTEQRPVE